MTENRHFCISSHYSVGWLSGVLHGSGGFGHETLYWAEASKWPVHTAVVDAACRFGAQLRLLWLGSKSENQKRE